MDRSKTLLWHILAWLTLCKARTGSVARVAKTRPSRILVVCHGNIYRSAFAGEWLRARVPSGVLVRSAGFHPQSGRRSPVRHVAMAHERGVDLSRHASAVIGPGDVRWAEIVVLMDRRNWTALRRMGADSEKLVWLGAFAPGNVEIEDPYRMDDAAASELLDRLIKCAEGLVDCVNCSRRKAGIGVRN